MNTIEEQLWSYIDQSCTTAEKSEIEAKLAIDSSYHQLYLELLKVHESLEQLDLEEPSMSFARNVMEQVNLELKPVALKTKVDNRIVYSIATFFVLSLIGIFSYAIANSDLKIDFSMHKLNIPLKVDQLITPTSLIAFLFVDVVLALLYIDSYLRKRKDLSSH